MVWFEPPYGMGDVRKDLQGRFRPVLEVRMPVLPPPSPSPKKTDREVSAAALDRYAHLSLVFSFIAQGYDKAQAIAAAADIPLIAVGGRIRYLSPRTQR